MGDLPKASEEPILARRVPSLLEDAAAPAETSSAGSPPAEAVPSPAREQPPVSWRELLAIAAMVALADVAVYRGHGFAGYAALFVGAPILLLFGSPQPRFSAGLWAVGVMLAASAVRLAWCGWGLPVACGMVLMVAFAMVLAGIRPYLVELVVFASQSILSGYEGLAHYRRSAARFRPVRLRAAAWLNFAMPLAALVAFGLLFIVANPDLLEEFGHTMDWLLTTIRQWIIDLVPSWREALFWAGVAWITIGLLRPVSVRLLATAPGRESVGANAPPADAPLYVPFRNTLLTVIALFAVYLVFEFNTLWFRKFPPGFYYSGYAHEGAAWLTVALALATVVLSLIFRGAVLRDTRLRRLRRLAWGWALENVVLAAAVYHRLLIYVGFNGMTRMRTVGFFGISCVLVGFILVVWKIIRQRDFLWLLRRQLWALGLFVYLYGLTPVDCLAHPYNVRRIMTGDSAPSVQISVHPINSEGILSLLPLVDCPDSIVRAGVVAMLADRHDEAERLARNRQGQGWTAYQLSDQLLLEHLRLHQSKWVPYLDRAKRREARTKFYNYAFQWY